MAREMKALMKALGDDCNGGLMVVVMIVMEKALGDDCNGGLMVVAAVYGEREI